MCIRDRHDVVVHRPVAARLQLLDIVVEAGAAHLVAHASGVDVLVVEIEDDLVLAPFQQVFQARDLVGGDVAVTVYDCLLYTSDRGAGGHRLPDADRRVGAVAAAGILHRRQQGPQRRPAAQPGQVGDGGITSRRGLPEKSCLDGCAN